MLKQIWQQIVSHPGQFAVAASAVAIGTILLVRNLIGLIGCVWYAIKTKVGFKN